MRRSKRASSQEQAWDLLSRAPEVHLATRARDGSPLLRTLNGVVCEGWVLFHGAVAGEKNEGLGQPAVVSAYETICQVPSYFIDERMACPATTYYRSVQAKGLLLEVTDDRARRTMLEELMKKLQPEGRYESLLEDQGIYDKELRAVRVIGVRIDALSGKQHLGQDRPPERTSAVVSGLWKRGAPGDPAAIETILEESPLARPDSLRSAGQDLVVSPSADLANQHATLLTPEYWRQGVCQEDIIASILGSSAWVGLVDAGGRLLGAARASTDRAWVGRICDVVVHPEHRGRGIGRALLTTLLDHPAVRHVRSLSLGTKNQGRLYESFGFEVAFLDEASGTLEMRRRSSRSISSQSPPT